MNSIGIIRNEEGRITDTGWPHVSRKLWEAEHKELVASYEQQSIYENKLIHFLHEGKATLSMRNSSIMCPGLNYNLAATTLLDLAKTELLARSLPYAGVHIADIGCGNAQVTARLVEFGDISQIPNQTWLRQHKPFIKTALTSIIRFDEEILRTSEKICNTTVRQMCIEDPEDELYNFADILLAQNSVFFYTSLPELAAKNIWKILKPGGVALVTFPLQKVDDILAGDEVPEMLKNLSLFEIERKENKGDAGVLRLMKI